MDIPELVAPDRPPHVSRCRIGRIRVALGYRQARTFERMLGELVEIAASAAG